jgi:hypothetical protein
MKEFKFFSKRMEEFSFIPPKKRMEGFLFLLPKKIMKEFKFSKRMEELFSTP